MPKLGYWVRVLKPYLNMRKCSLLFLLVSVSALAGFPLAMSKPNWLDNGLYVTYEQFFVWSGHSESRNMTWQITHIEDDLVDLSLTSYTVDNALSVILVSSDFRINSETREVVDSSDANVIGRRWPFWIETDVTLGSIVDTWFGTAKISGDEMISALGEQRDMWVLEYNWSSTSAMKRWYDKASGVVLQIYVALLRAGTQVQVTETAKWTNLNLPPSQSGPSVSSWTWMWLSAFILIIAIILAGVAMLLKLKKRRKDQKLT